MCVVASAFFYCYQSSDFKRDIGGMYTPCMDDFMRKICQLKINKYEIYSIRMIREIYKYI